MTAGTFWAAWLLILAFVPVTVYWFNLRGFRRPPLPARPLPPISVLIPARDEEGSIGAAVESVLASEGVDGGLEVIVLDDGSADRTAEIVAALAARDARLRLETAPPLPDGWCGKQHACHVLAGHARHDVLVFVDADVRLAADGLARAAGFLLAGDAALVSGFPHQETGTFLERLLIPLIHVVLLGYLPLWRMRATTRPAYGAGCGQLFAARREAYRAAGGHAAIRASLHDGVQLPRALRRAGFATDLFDATTVATCRMYRRAGEVWRGLAKNATEGLASPAAIVPWTLILGLGQVLPVLLLALFAATGVSGSSWYLALAATVASYLPRLHAAVRFRQSWLGAALHPLGVALLLAIQWWALGKKLLGRPAGWKGRSYGAAP